MREQMKWVGAALLLCVGGLFAAERVWNGMAADGKFSSAQNWEGGILPNSGDTLRFTNISGTLENDLAGLSVSGFTLSSSGAVTWGGEKMTVTGPVVLDAGGKLEISTPLCWESTEPFAMSGNEVVLSGALSGTCPFQTSGSSKLSLSGDNSAFTGAFVFSNGVVQVLSNLSLGTENPVTFYANPTNARLPLVIQAAGVYRNPITLYNGGEGSLEVNAPVTNTAQLRVIGQSRIRAEAWNSYFVLSGGVVDPSHPGDIVWNGSIHFMGDEPIALADNFYFDVGTISIGAPIQSATLTLIAKGSATLTKANVLKQDGTLQIGANYGKWGTLNLNGFDQTIGTLQTAAGTESVADRIKVIRSPEGKSAQLTVTYGGAYDGIFSGAVSVLLDSAQEKSLTLSGTESDTTGSLAVRKGTLMLTETVAFPRLSSVEVTGEGVLSMGTTSIYPGGCRLVLADQGKLSLPSESTWRVYSAQTNGVMLETGMYDASTLPSFLQGTGKIEVLFCPVEPYEKEDVWTGAGADLNATTAENWKSGAVPDFDSGKSRLRFAEGGAEMVWNQTGAVYGLTLLSENAFSIRSASEEEMVLGAGGLTVGEDAATGSYSLDVPMELSFLPQRWNVASNTLLTINRPISSQATSIPLVKDGAGTLRLGGDNAEMMAPLVISNGSVEVTSDTALGAPSRAVEIGGYKWNQGSKLRFIGARTNDVPLDCYGFVGELTQPGGRLVQRGAVSSLANGMHLRCQGTVIFEGGLNALHKDHGIWFQTYNGSHTWIQEKPLVTPEAGFSQDDGGWVHLAATNNVWNIYNIYGGRLVCEQPNVLCSNGWVRIGINWRRNGTLDLNGHDQRSQAVMHGWGEISSYPDDFITVTSAVPAVLTMTEQYPRTTPIRFFGEAGFRYQGTGAYTMIYQVSETKGLLRVSSGSVVLDEEAGWQGSTNVVVDGTGVLRVNQGASDTAFGTGEASIAKLQLNDSGRMYLEEGVSATVDTLSIQGVPCKSGTYGSAESAAQVKLPERFEGTGLLRVLRSDIKGSLFMIR